ncbi:MAG TPA: hypothetical protein VD704_05490 [Gaiellaceae bacterium]|nr:hypothetical protein [Gaiellaceae bacterium]
MLAAGAVVAALAALSARYTISVFPPGLDEKTEVSYTASTRLLVTSAQNPYARTGVSFVEQIQRPDEGAAAEGEEGAAEDAAGTGGADTQPVIISNPSDFNTLIRLANLYPLLIESDQVARYRHEEFGTLPGSVSAQGIYSVATGNRFELSEIPVIQLVAVSGTPRGAVELADKTAKAFIGWLEQEQTADEIPNRDRIVIDQINVPTAAAASAGPSTTLPLLVFVVVFGAFCVLAVLLDRLLGPSPAAGRAEVDAVEPVEVKKSA